MPLAIKEEDFKRQVTSAAEFLGWKWVHWRPLRTKHGWQTPYDGPLGKGWPDLTLTHERKQRMLFAELKSQNGDVDPEQQDLIDYLRRCGQEAYIWRPSDLSEILAVLSR